MRLVNVQGKIWLDEKMVKFCGCSEVGELA
jgi:hypothetical protein